MELNHDCVRDSLLYLEKELTYGKHYIISSNEVANEVQGNDDHGIDFPADVITYALEKLFEAGYINGKPSKYLSGSTTMIVSSITWQGHAFLDNVRPKPAWDKVKAGAKSIGSSSLEVLSKIAVEVISKMLTEQLGI